MRISHRATFCPHPLLRPRMPRSLKPALAAVFALALAPAALQAQDQTSCVGAETQDECLALPPTQEATNFVPLVLPALVGGGALAAIAAGGGSSTSTTSTN